MPSEKPASAGAEKRILQAALKPGDGCLAVEHLEMFLGDSPSPPAALVKHVESCAFCQTEIQLLREFEAGSPRETETEAVQQIAARLGARSHEIFKAGAQIEPREQWWRTFGRAPWLSGAALAFASVLLVVAVGLRTRNAPPDLHPPVTDREVLRSNAITLTTPAGDIQQVPAEIRWQKADGATRYDIRLLEVDGAELWTAQTTESGVELPAAIRARIVPDKTLFWQVSAFDGTGRQVATSGTVRFRVLRKLE